MSSYTEPDLNVGGTVFRIMRREAGVKYGLEIVLTAEAIERYGEGPTIATVLHELRRHAEEGLPAVEPGQEYERLVFTGD